MSSGTYARQRRTHLESLAERLPEHGLAGRLVGGDDPVLWVWHPRTGNQTIVFATPAGGGWLFLWSPDGQETTDEPGQAAQTVGKQLSRTGSP